jgi:mycothiol synthase
MNSTPLSERVTAPVIAELAPVEGITWRPARIDDLDAIADVVREMGLADHPNYVESKEEVEEILTFSWVDLSVDTRVALDADGTIVAFGLVDLAPTAEDFVRSTLQGGVVPRARGRGIGRALLAWQEQRALQQLASSELTLPGWIQLYADDRATASVRLIERSGFAAVRWFRGMDHLLGEDIPPIALPDGLELRQLTPELAEQAWIAKNDSFRDHWGSQLTPREAWDTMMTMDIMRLDLSWAAIDGDRIAGLVMTFVNEDDWELAGYSSGYIGLVGVIRDWRRKGIAPSLLATAMQSFRQAGLQRACLDVDSENPSGADSLYTGMGFFETSRSMAFTKVF